MYRLLGALIALLVVGIMHHSPAATGPRANLAECLRLVLGASGGIDETDFTAELLKTPDIGHIQQRSLVASPEAAWVRPAVFLTGLIPQRDLDVLIAPHTLPFMNLVLTRTPYARARLMSLGQRWFFHAAMGAIRNWEENTLTPLMALEALESLSARPEFAADRDLLIEMSEIGNEAFASIVRAWIRADVNWAVNGSETEEIYSLDGVELLLLPGQEPTTNDGRHELAARVWRRFAERGYDRPASLQTLRDLMSWSPPRSAP